MFSSLLKRKPALSSHSPNQARTPSGPDGLSDLQLVILSRAAQHPEGHAGADGHSDAEIAVKAVEALVERDLLVGISEADDPRGGGIVGEKPLRCWRITAAGLGVIGVEESQMPEAYRRRLSSSDKGTEQGPIDQKEAMTVHGLPQATLSAPKAKRAKRTGARATDQEAATGKLSANDIGPAVQRTSTGASEPDTQTNRSRLVGVLSRTEGATIPEIMEATGWLAHSARAALSGLRKQGHIIQRGRPSGDRGTVYRIAAEAPSDTAAEG